MKRFLPLTLLFVSLMSATASANHLYLFVNSGSGDNFAYVSNRLNLSGGTDNFFLGNFSYPPGWKLGDGALYLYSTVISIDGIPTEFFFPGAGTISMYPLITIPTDGREFFRAFVHISFSHTGVTFDKRADH